MIGIVADDITGANDIGIMYTKAGWITHVYTYPATIQTTEPLPDVLIVDTNSRLDSSKEAYDKVFHCTKAIKKLGVKQFFNKTCSVFRGNIGAEFDAMLDALERDFAVIVLGFPKNGRTTIHGVHYVHGKKLEESEFRNDPVHPMRKSNLIDILQEQTDRKVDYIDIDIVKQGSRILKNEIDKKKKHCNYLILDVEDQITLKIIAEAIKDEKIICGASGIAEELAKVIGSPDQDKRVNPVQKCHVGILCAAGSLMPQTKRQIKTMEENGFPVFEMKTNHLFSDSIQEQIEKLVGEIVRLINEGKDVLVHTSNEEEIIKETKRIGKELGLSDVEVSRTVSDSLARIVLKVIEETGANRMLLAGGETSATICKQLNIDSLSIWEEIEPGLPSCISLNEPQRMLVLKSGSFGGDDFFLKAIDHLKSN